MANNKWLNPVGVLTGTVPSEALETGSAVPLAGSKSAFCNIEILSKVPNGGFESTVLPVLPSNSDVGSLIGERPAFAGLCLNRPVLIGVLNVTPDSFSDGGDFFETKKAVSRACELVLEGADIVDIGGESTRPGATPLEENEELERLLPVVKATVAEGIRVSVDTRRATVMKAAIDAGVSVINDVTALTGDQDAINVIASSDVSVVLMHMQGQPQNMQNNPRYSLASIEIFDWLQNSVEACVAAGLPRNRIAVDPGIGFGKTHNHNMEILNRIGMFHGIGCAVAVGVSRKSFLGHIGSVELPKNRLPGTIAATMFAISRGVQIHRVHDLAAVKQAIDVWDACSLGNV